jgi:hypothetical protein
MAWFDVRDRQGKLHLGLVSPVQDSKERANDGARFIISRLQRLKATNAAKLD